MTSCVAPVPAMASREYKSFVYFLEPFIRNESVIEVMVYPDGHVLLIDREQQATSPRLTLPNLESFQQVVQEWAFYHGQRLNPLHPMSAGSCFAIAGRWQAAMAPVMQHGALFCLRKHISQAVSLKECFGTDHLVEKLSNSEPYVPTIIFGDTGSGKTTLMLCLLHLWASKERVVILERDAECPSWGAGWISLSCSDQDLGHRELVTMDQLLSLALRLRPDRICISEIRMQEGSVWLHALNIGHGGVLTTMHGSHWKEVILRLELLIGRRRLMSALQGKCIRFIGMKRAQPSAIESVEYVSFHTNHWGRVSDSL